MQIETSENNIYDCIMIMDNIHIQYHVYYTYMICMYNIHTYHFSIVVGKRGGNFNFVIYYCNV